MNKIIADRVKCEEKIQKDDMMEIIWEAGQHQICWPKRLSLRRQHVNSRRQHWGWGWGWGSSFLQPLSLPPSGTPKGVDFTAVRDLLLSVEGVEALHSLHIWALTVSQPVLSVHIAIGEWSGYSGQGEREAARGLGPSPKQPTTSDVCWCALNLAPC